MSGNDYAKRNTGHFLFEDIFILKTFMVKKCSLKKKFSKKLHYDADTVPYHGITDYLLWWTGYSWFYVLVLKYRAMTSRFEHRILMFIVVQILVQIVTISHTIGLK